MPSTAFVRDNAHVTNDPAAASITAGPAGICVHAEPVDLDAELHLGKFRRVVLLSHVIHRVDAVSMRAGAETDGQAFDAELEQAGHAVVTAQIIEHVTGGGGRDVAAGRLGQGPRTARC